MFSDILSSNFLFLHTFATLQVGAYGWAWPFYKGVYPIIPSLNARFLFNGANLFNNYSCFVELSLSEIVTLLTQFFLTQEIIPLSLN